jgi:hypothetical protein
VAIATGKNTISRDEVWRHDPLDERRTGQRVAGDERRPRADREPGDHLEHGGREMWHERPFGHGLD